MSTKTRTSKGHEVWSIRHRPELHFWKVSSLSELLKEAILNGGQYELFQKEGRHKTGADIYTAASQMWQQQTQTECLGNLLLRTASLLTFTSDFTFQCTHCAMGIWWQKCRQASSNFAPPGKLN